MSGLDVSIHGSIGRLNERRWNSLVEQSKLGSCFHRTEWLAAVEAGLDLDPFHVTVEHDRNLVAVCPNFVSDLRLPEAVSFLSVGDFREVASTNPGFGGPVIATRERDALEAIADAIDAATGVRVLSHYLRTGDAGYGRYAQSLDVLGYTPSVLNCRFVIDLEKDKEEIIADMDRSRRRSLRKAREIDTTSVPSVSTGT